MSARGRARRTPWMVPAGLVLLSLVPALGGIARVDELTGNPAVTAENARFINAPLPVLIHIPAAMLYSMLGAFQFAPALRQRHRWHRSAGRVVLPAALLVAISGLWMTLTYPWPAQDGVGVYLERLVFGAAMLFAVLAGIAGIRRRDFTVHGEWMTRAYAIGMGAGTQVLTHLPWFIFVDMHPGPTPRAIMMGGAWILNIAVAEWIIRRSRAPGARVPARGAAPAAPAPRGDPPRSPSTVLCKERHDTRRRHQPRRTTPAP